MTKVHLLGKAGEKFGKEFTLDVKHAQQLLRAIAVQRKGFLNFFFDEQEKGVEYVFKKGKDFLQEGEQSLSFGEEEIFIMPVAQGSFLSDGAKRDLGAILTVIGTIAVMFGQGWGYALIIVGGYLMFDGILGLVQDDSPAKNEDPAIFGGPVNVAKQGIPIPLCYGKMEVSGAPINFGFTTTRLKQNAGWVNINNPDQDGAGDVGGGIGGGTGAGAVQRR